MTDILNYIFPSGIMDTFTPENLVCFFMFLLLFESLCELIGCLLGGGKRL